MQGPSQSHCFRGSTRMAAATVTSMLVTPLPLTTNIEFNSFRSLGVCCVITKAFSQVNSLNPHREDTASKTSYFEQVCAKLISTEDIYMQIMFLTRKLARAHLTLLNKYVLLLLYTETPRHISLPLTCQISYQMPTMHFSKLHAL